MHATIHHKHDSSQVAKGGHQVRGVLGSVVRSAILHGVDAVAVRIEELPSVPCEAHVADQLPHASRPALGCARVVFLDVCDDALDAAILLEVFMIGCLIHDVGRNKRAAFICRVGTLIGLGWLYPALLSIASGASVAPIRSGITPKHTSLKTQACTRHCSS